MTNQSDGDLTERIRERAYEIWEKEGRPDARDAAHWRQAAEEFETAAQELAQQERDRSISK